MVPRGTTQETGVESSQSLLGNKNDDQAIVKCEF